MMNGVALFLILTSLVSGSFVSPPDENNPNPNVIIKEGHQFVVVEYDQEGQDGNTKVSISPQYHQTENSKEETSTKRVGARELVCDAFGKCKHRIADALGKVEDQTKEEVSKGVDKAKEVAGEGHNKLKDAIQNVKESEIVKKPTRTMEDIGRNMEMKDVMDEGKSKVKDVYEKVKQVDVVDTPKRVAEDVERNVSKVMEFVQRVVKGGASKLKEEGKENANRLGEMVEKVADGTKDSGHRMRETAKRAGDLASDGLKGGAHMVREMAEKSTIKTHKSLTRSLKDILYSGGINSMVGVLHLLGFSVAFGMSMWVTFASSYILRDALPRQQFGMLQSKVYPVYFKVQACSIGVALIAHLYGRKFLLNRWEVINVTNIVISVLLSLVNLRYLEPRATQVMFQRVKLEKDAGRGRVTSRLTSGIADDAGDEPVTATTERQEEVQPETETCALSEKLRTWNRLSSYVNVMTLMSLSLHLVYLGQKIQAN
ncbi:hypothetical protein POM88_015049 [Heracleum sosnowskyi]|uniref:TMEM205-like domain-containing protein n=1 Tax=Heracleum sosnowskyi TaxID=360622 RepID=A0AAD8IJT9_9APIA|nr:hypothetical protein POM88_015049 [Heracleum sosnowskyi]